jgi:hypothetical protein
MLRLINCYYFYPSQNILRIRGHMLELYIPRNRNKNNNQNIRERNDLNSTPLSSKNKSVPLTSILTNEFFPIKKVPTLRNSYSIPSDASINDTQNATKMQKNNNSVNDIQTMNQSNKSKGIGKHHTLTMKYTGYSTLK